MTVEPKLLSIPDAAIMLGISEPTLWKWVYKQWIESVKLRGCRKIRVEEIQRIIDDNVVPAQPVKKR